MIFFVNETYDKLSYFDLYGNSVIIFIFATLFVFIVDAVILEFAVNVLTVAEFPTIDVNVIKLVEKLLVVIEAGSTPRNMAIAAMKRLKSSGIKPLGVIFNKMKNDPLGYGYDYYYYYAHGYYGDESETSGLFKGKKKPRPKSKG